MPDVGLCWRDRRGAVLLLAISWALCAGGCAIRFAPLWDASDGGSDITGDRPPIDDCGTFFCPGRGCVAPDDPTNCGACGTSCPDRPNASGACQSGRCAIACNDGWGDCNGNPDDGCETDLRGSVGHCGMCGNTCAGASNADAVCNNRVCGFRCIAGFDDCNRNPADGCEAPLNTTTNCGSCGTGCFMPRPVCGGGMCITGCGAGQTNCSGSCVDVGSDPTNCGGCGTRCPSGPNSAPVCAGGRCSLRCAAGFQNCDGNPGNGCESFQATDVNNCSTCGNRCPSGANSMPRCVGSACSIVCSSGGAFGDCDGNPSTGCEQSLNVQGHCGACRVTCPPRANASGVCIAATRICSINCAGGYGNCNGDPGDGCESNLQTDNANCGTCGNACGGSQTCCSGTCQNLLNNNTHCGRCGNACGAQRCCTLTCVSLTTTMNCGGCGVVCGGGQVCCTSGCATLMTDRMNCGACGRACAAGQTCCGGACVNTGSDTNNCGACGTMCGAANRCCGGACTPINTANCAGCGMACAAGQSCCGTSCANLMTDPRNCGACGTSCSAGQSCCSGTCTTTNGNDAHCGMCGNACGGGQSCCGTRCVNRMSDPANCGACGTTCSGTQGCCTGVCTDLTTSPNCGACGTSCTAPEMCCSRMCRLPALCGGSD